jgi:hypothetical protein
MNNQFWIMFVLSAATSWWAISTLWKGEAGGWVSGRPARRDQNSKDFWLFSLVRIAIATVFVGLFIGGLVVMFLKGKFDIPL